METHAQCATDVLLYKHAFANKPHAAQKSRTATANSAACYAERAERLNPVSLHRAIGHGAMHC